MLQGLAFPVNALIGSKATYMLKLQFNSLYRKKWIDTRHVHKEMGLNAVLRKRLKRLGLEPWRVTLGIHHFPPGNSEDFVQRPEKSGLSNCFVCRTHHFWPKEVPHNIWGQAHIRKAVPKPCPCSLTME